MHAFTPDTVVHPCVLLCPSKNTVEPNMQQELFTVFMTALEWDES